MPGRQVSFVELLGRVSTCASWIRQQGCVADEIVAITVADDVTHMVASLAFLSLGIPHVCLPSYDPVAKRLDIAKRLGVQRVLLTEWRDALPNLQALLLTREHFEPAAQVNPLTASRADPDADALYYASSGATGDAKIFAITHRCLQWRSECMSKSEQMVPMRPHRSITVVPAEEPMGKSRLLYCAYLGVTSVLATGKTLSSFSLQELCISLDAKSVELGVLQLAGLMHDRRDQRPLPDGTMVLTAGSRVRPKLRQEFRERFGVPLWVHYGTREFGRIAFTFPDGDDGIETVGKALPWIDFEIVDHRGDAVPQGEIGEIRLRSKYMVAGYIGDPIATSRHFRDGWFYPRDLVSLTPEGRLCLHGRTDDMMNLNGIKIFPAEIERVLEEHPAVKAAAAFSKVSATHGDIPVAAVELHASAVATVDELMAHVRSRLGVRAPRKIIVLDTLPRNSAGKFVKRDLAQLVTPNM